MRWFCKCVEICEPSGWKHLHLVSDQMRSVAHWQLCWHEMEEMCEGCLGRSHGVLLPPNGFFINIIMSWILKDFAQQENRGLLCHDLAIYTATATFSRTRELRGGGDVTQDNGQLIIFISSRTNRCDCILLMRWDADYLLTKPLLNLEWFVKSPIKPAGLDRVKAIKHLSHNHPARQTNGPEMFLLNCYSDN